MKPEYSPDVKYVEKCIRQTFESSLETMLASLQAYSQLAEREASVFVKLEFQHTERAIPTVSVYTGKKVFK